MVAVAKKNGGLSGAALHAIKTQTSIRSRAVLRAAVHLDAMLPLLSIASSSYCHGSALLLPLRAPRRTSVRLCEPAEYDLTLTKPLGIAFEETSSGYGLEVGQCVQHKQSGYVGVIVGWDNVCRRPEAWCRLTGVDALPRGRSQPFCSVVKCHSSQRPRW